MSESFHSGPPPPRAILIGPPPMVLCWQCRNSLTAMQPTCIYCGAMQSAPSLHEPHSPSYDASFAPGVPINDSALPTAIGITAETSYPGDLSGSYSTRTPAPSCGARSHADPISPIVKLIGYFGAMLFTSIVFAAVYRSKFSELDEPGPVEQQWMLYALLVVEAIDTVIVLLAWSNLKRPDLRQEFPGQGATTVWMAAAPGLALLLALNFGYHSLLRTILPAIDGGERMLAGREWLYLVGYCLQPAIIEELFFRGLALDWFRTEMSTRGALIVSSVMFGVCHVYTPIGVPYLIIAGLAFGLARIMTGGLLLPITLHFLHNLAVTLVEHYRSI